MCYVEGEGIVYWDIKFVNFLLSDVLLGFDFLVGVLLVKVGDFGLVFEILNENEI